MNGPEDLSYDVRIYQIDVYEGKRRKTYRVRWWVAGEVFPKRFTTRKLAESFQSKLLTAAREGVPFDRRSGLPAPMAKQLHSRSWFEHACDYVDVKWAHASPGHRRGISETLTQASLSLVASDRGKPDETALRRALYRWAFNKTARDGADIGSATPPTEMTKAIRWIAENSVKLSDFDDATIPRRALDALALLQNGRAAAASTIARRRATLHGALQYAVEQKHLPSNPIDNLQWVSPKQEEEVDRRVVVNPTQARNLLAAVHAIYPSLEAFYGCMYYAALRPAEVRSLTKDQLTLPATDWGEALLTGSTQHTGRAWTDSGEARDDRPLKHRSERSTRIVPLCPDLVALLVRHLDEYGTGPDGRLFVTRTGPFGRVVAKPYCNPVHPNTSSRFWAKARRKALTPAQVESPLARRPYDLRHACVSLWLNAGVPATQVAEWAGHSVHVLLRVYAKCIDGQAEAAKRRIEAALRPDDSAEAA